jgi:glycosyltransferase 2 family protein
MSETPAAPRPSIVQRVLVLALKIAVSAGLLWLLLSRIDLGRLWGYARYASLPWLAAGLALYLGMIVVSAWRWQLLLAAQRIHVGKARLVNSYLVATFFNNFLPSNIGGDVVRIRDIAPAAGSKTLATTVILMDRGIGLLGLFIVAAVGATATSALSSSAPWLAPALWIGLALGLAVAVPLVMAPGHVARLLSPLRRLHADWVGERIARLTDALRRFGQEPKALLSCFVGAIVVQGVLVAFYVAIVQSMNIQVSAWHLSVIVPISFIVQMAPVSVNGFGVREATFTYYFSRLQLPAESAIAVSFMGAALIMLFSLSGGAAYVLRSYSPAWAAPIPRETEE